jgi:sugar lactone lactonase YvrE
LGYGAKDTDLASLTLTPQTTGISLAFGQTMQITPPTAKGCKGDAVTVGAYTYGSSNLQVVDISPSGNLCAGSWNRNSGGGIANYTTCSIPTTLPTTGGLPYATAYVTASANSVTSNPVEVYVHSQVASVTLVGPTQCLSQGNTAQLDAQACYAAVDPTSSNPNPIQFELCAPASVTNYACKVPTKMVNGVATPISIPTCTSAIGTLNYQVATPSVGILNQETNQITAAQPGTTAVSASVAGSAASAGYFSTCPPASIKVTLANGATTGTVTQGVAQNLTTTIYDTNNVEITGLTLDYQSTDPIDIATGTAGAITTNFPGVASITAICQPSTCNPAPINVFGFNGTGLPISSNPVTITTPGTASQFAWFGAPGQSQYFVPIEVLTGTASPNVRLPYVPNSMVMDRLGTNLYFGSQHALMIYAAASNAFSKQDTSAPGVVLAVAPNNSTLLINDQVRQLFYIYSSSSGVMATFGGMGTAAAWTPDSKTLYITDTASAGPGHTNTLYVYNQNTGFTSCTAGQTCAYNFNGAKNLAITVPSVGAYFSGSPTVSRTWCPSGTVGNYASMTFYPQGDAVNATTDILAATTDGKHILGVSQAGGAVTLSDIGLTVPTTECPGAGSGTLSPLSTGGTNLTPTPLPVNVSATAVNQIVPSPASNLAFITYQGSTPGAQLPYYVPGTGGAAGHVYYLSLTGGTAITAPVAGAFSPDNTLFFVSTSGDNLIHAINLKTLTDESASQLLAPNLPACDPNVDLGCTLTATPSNNTVPATVITVKARSTT